MLNIRLHKILDIALCWELLREARWAEGRSCPHCGSTSTIGNGHDTSCPEKRKYTCKGCGRHFDDLTGTVFSGSHHPLHHWLTVLYLMSLNVSNLQIAKELDISENTAQQMCSAIREGVVKKSLFYSLAGKWNLTNVTLWPVKKVVGTR